MTAEHLLHPKLPVGILWHLVVQFQIDPFLPLMCQEIGKFYNEPTNIAIITWKPSVYGQQQHRKPSVYGQQHRKPSVYGQQQHRWLQWQQHLYGIYFNKSCHLCPWIKNTRWFWAGYLRSIKTKFGSNWCNSVLGEDFWKFVDDDRPVELRMKHAYKEQTYLTIDFHSREYSLFEITTIWSLSSETSKNIFWKSPWNVLNLQHNSMTFKLILPKYGKYCLYALIC